MGAKHTTETTRVQGPAESVTRPRKLALTKEVVAANERLVDALIRADEAAGDAQQREFELRENGEFRELLIGIVGHDLRSPLAAMTLGANLLASSKTMSAQEHEIAVRLVSSGNRMKHIIAQLLDFTRARLGGGFPLEITKVDLVRVVELVADELRIATGRNIIVQKSGDLVGEWDAERLGAVFSNVMGNAAQHGRAETPLEISLRGDDDDVVVCEVTNLGEPIPLELLGVLFAPFRQRDPLEHRANGNVGLGLYIAHEIVRAHGGTIRVASGGGSTTFTIALPRRPR